MSDEGEQELPEAAEAPAAGLSDDWPRLSDLELEVCLLAAAEPSRARSSARRAWDDGSAGLTDGHVDRR